MAKETTPSFVLTLEMETNPSIGMSHSDHPKFVED